jgi:selenocysteine-specific elongation factor
VDRPFILGTAGHIDHGKTALVKAMTGVDCDRLEEEKRRGITIELGFAPLRLPGGKTVSVIDVPGHERFIRQMAAGASGMDAALLVIAASEGVMPQTREHLDILGLLGVRSGIVALTKTDLADGETREIAAAEAAELIRGTCLDGAAVLPVSAATGEGIPRILEEIGRILDALPPREGFGAFFLPVDRVFSKKGFGAVVTGTACQGMVQEGDEVEVLPSGALGRVRAVQTHGAKAAGAAAGQRTALNLSGVSLDALDRGYAVCSKGAYTPTRCLSAQLEVLPSASQGVAHWQRVRFHAGTADIAARISLLRLDAGDQNRAYLPGTGGPVQILPESPIPAAAGQRFVIRFYSPLVTIGGGRIMLPNAVPSRGRTDRLAKAALVEALAADFGPVSFLAALVKDRGVLSAAGLAGLSQMDRAAFQDHLSALSGSAEERGLLVFGKARHFITQAAFDRSARSAQRVLRKFHAAYPELAGMDGEKLYAALDGAHGAGRIAGGDGKDLIGLLAARNAIAAIPGAARYRAMDFCRSLDNKFMVLADRARDALEEAGFNLLTPADLEGRLKASAAEARRVIGFLREEGEVWQLEGARLASRRIRDNLLAKLASMPGGVTVAALRDAIGVNRKLALALLDMLDSQGFTQRDGDARILAPGV